MYLILVKTVKPLENLINITNLKQNIDYFEKGKYKKMILTRKHGIVDKIITKLDK